MNSASNTSPTRCPACRRPSRRSHEICRECTHRHGAAAAKLLAHSQSDPTFAAAFIGQLRPDARDAVGRAMMRRWLRRARGTTSRTS